MCSREEEWSEQPERPLRNPGLPTLAPVPVNEQEEGDITCWLWSPQEHTAAMPFTQGQSWLQGTAGQSWRLRRERWYHHHLHIRKHSSHSSLPWNTVIVLSPDVYLIFKNSLYFACMSSLGIISKIFPTVLSVMTTETYLKLASFGLTISKQFLCLSDPRGGGSPPSPSSAWVWLVPLLCHTTHQSLSQVDFVFGELINSPNRHGVLSLCKSCGQAQVAQNEIKHCSHHLLRYYVGQNDNRKEGWVGQSPAPHDVTWAIGEQVRQVGFVQKALCWSEFFTDSRGKFWLLQHKARGVRLFKWLLKALGNQNSLRKLEVKFLPDALGAGIIRITSSNHP